MKPISNPRRRSVPSLLGRGGAMLAAVAMALLLPLLPLRFIGPVPIWGVLDTGIADPLRWAPGALVLALVSGLVTRRMFWPLLAIAALGSGIGLFCAWATGSPVMFRLAWLIVTLLVAVAVGRFARSRKPRGAVLLALALLVLTVPMFAPPRARPAGLRVAVMTGLPLFWREGEGVASLSRRARDQHWLEASVHRITALDRLDTAALAGVGRLLLAQPRLLAPAELVALDRWVRDGGRLVLLADPLLTWPSPLAAGDRMRPPLTSLLDPLFDHWGLELNPVGPDATGVARRLLPGGTVLLTRAASAFHATGPASCRWQADGFTGLCAIGKGQVRLVADADLLDDRLWLVGPGHAADVRAQAADNVAMIDRWLADPADMGPLPGPARITDEAALIAGLRLALLAGLGWAVLGTCVEWVGSGRDKSGGRWRMTKKRGLPDGSSSKGGGPDMG